MQSRDFVYWLQGFFELADPKALTEKQTDLVKRHLNLVFLHEIDPSHSDDPKVQGALQAVHDGLDVTALRDQLEQLQNLATEDLEKICSVDPLTPLPAEKLRELEQKLKETKEIAVEALNRPMPRPQGGVKRYMC